MEDDHFIPPVEGYIPLSFGVLLEGGPGTHDVQKRLGYILMCSNTKKIGSCCIVLHSETSKPYSLLTPFSRILEKSEPWTNTLP